MKIREILEMASVGGTCAGGIAPVSTPTKKKRSKNKPSENALDSKENLLGGKPLKR